MSDFAVMFSRENMALTDSGVLYEALEKAEGNVDAVGEIFNDLRWTDMRALQDLQIVRQSISRRDFSTWFFISP